MKNLRKNKVNVIANVNNKIFTFDGMGHYSETFGWDNGLSSDLGKRVSVKMACKQEQSGVEYSNFYSYCLGEYPLEEKGVFPNFHNEYGGTRNVSGFVVASNKKEAELLLKEFDSEHEQTCYER